MRGKIGFLISHSDNYYGIERGLHIKAKADLQQVANRFSCDVIDFGPIKTGEEAREAKEFFDSSEIDYLIMFIADFTAGDVMTAFEDVSYPIGLWFPREPHQDGDIQLNAAVTANMFSSIAQRYFKNKVSCDWYYGGIEDELVKNRLTLNLRVITARKNIEYATVGVLGDVAPTFYNLENKTLQDCFPHMRFLKCDVEDLKRAVVQVSKEEEEEAYRLITAGSNSIEAEEKSIRNSAKVYVALKKYVLENKIDCMAAACWPDFQDAFQIVPCVIYTLLGSELNVPVACEGDIGGAISLLMAKELSDSMPTLMDLTSIVPETESLLLWHCGIGSKALEPETGVRIINHPMLDRKNPNRELMGLSYDYCFKPCELTVLRYSNNGKLICFECHVEESKLGYSGTRGFVNGFTYKDQSFNVNDVVDTIFKNGVEHHLIICPGRIETALRKLAQQMDIPVIAIERYQA